MISKFIESVGFELEGGINYPDQADFENFLKQKGWKNSYKMHEDGSLSGLDKDFNNCEVCFYSKDLKVIEEVLRHIYEEDDFEVNSSCGFHIHIKFRKKYRDEFLSIFGFKAVFEKFIELYLSNFKAKKYQDRIGNHYCNGKYDKIQALDQIENEFKDHSRYHAINLNAFQEYQTVEFRIMPFMEDANECMVAINWLIETVESFLIIFSSGEISEKEKVNLEDLESDRKLYETEKKQQIIMEKALCVD